VLSASPAIRNAKPEPAYWVAENCAYPTIASFSEFTPTDG
jgi:hypothetical protein